MNVAVAQIEVTKDIEKNVEKIVESIEISKIKGADIVCLPETCLQSVMEEQVCVKDEYEQIREYCAFQQIWAIVGSYIPGETKNRNYIALIDSSGNVVHEYDKVHLWHSEKPWVEEGKESARAVDTELGKIGIINCWDIAHPSYVQKIAKQGAEVIFSPSYLVNAEFKVPLGSITDVRAMENLSYIVMCDSFTPKTLRTSYISHPTKGKILSIEHKEDIVVANCDLSDIVQLRRKYHLPE